MDRKRRSLRLWSAAALLLAAAVSHEPSQAAAAAPECSERERAELLAPATPESRIARLVCSVKLDPADVVSRQIIIEGQAASGAHLDCNGARIEGEDSPLIEGRNTVIIRSLGRNPAEMAADRPTDVRISDCLIRGSIRIVGLRATQGEESLLASSRLPGHTERAQAAAPARILLEGLHIETNRHTAIYVASGATGVHIRNSRLTGTIGFPAIYLDSESKGNLIEKNSITVSSPTREHIAIDGSADNIVRNNEFTNFDSGGIYIYRNCGERGIVRHQKPMRNRIEGNVFTEGSASRPVPIIWIGSRGGRQGFCRADDGLGLGSSLSDADYADDNTVERNVFLTSRRQEILRDDGRGNHVAENTVRDHW